MARLGRRKLSALNLLTGAAWKCGSCEIEHHGMFDLGADASDHWGKVDTIEPNSALRFDGDFLSEDFCVLDGEHFFVRCIFQIPVHGVAETFGFGVWSTLSRENFEIYVEGFDIGQFQDEGPWPGWFGNRLNGFEDTLNAPCWVYPQPARQRPVVTLVNPDHNLSVAQNEGISPDRLLELYEAYGHRPAR